MRLRNASIHFSNFAISLLALTLLAITAVSTDTMRMGQGGQCNPAVDPDCPCPKGTHRENNRCVPNSKKCGRGTHLENNECVPNKIQTCPQGTHPVGRRCVPNDPPTTVFDFDKIVQGTIKPTSKKDPPSIYSNAYKLTVTTPERCVLQLQSSDPSLEVLMQGTKMGPVELQPKPEMKEFWLTNQMLPADTYTVSVRYTTSQKNFSPVNYTLLINKIPTIAFDQLLEGRTLRSVTEISSGVVTYYGECYLRASAQDRFVVQLQPAGTQHVVQIFDPNQSELPLDHDRQNGEIRIKTTRGTLPVDGEYRIRVQLRAASILTDPPNAYKLVFSRQPLLALRQSLSGKIDWRSSVLVPAQITNSYTYYNEYWFRGTRGEIPAIQLQSSMPGFDLKVWHIDRQIPLHPRSPQTPEYRLNTSEDAWPEDGEYRLRVIYTSNQRPDNLPFNLIIHRRGVTESVYNEKLQRIISTGASDQISLDERIHQLRGLINDDPRKPGAYEWLGMIYLYDRRDAQEGGRLMREAIKNGGAARFRIAHNRDWKRPERDGTFKARCTEPSYFLMRPEKMELVGCQGSPILVNQVPQTIEVNKVTVLMLPSGKKDPYYFSVEPQDMRESIKGMMQILYAEMQRLRN